MRHSSYNPPALVHQIETRPGMIGGLRSASVPDAAIVQLATRPGKSNALVSPRCCARGRARSGSRRAEAVEATGIIRPLRIAEIGCAVGADESVKRVGPH